MFSPPFRSNGPLRLCGIPGHEPLPSLTLISLFFSFAGHRGYAESVLYNFSNQGAWKRLTMYSDLYGSAMAGSSSRWW